MMPEDRKELYRLIEQWTRCELCYRFGAMGVPEFMQGHADHMDYEDKIRDLMFGTHDMLELATRWGIVRPLPKAQHKTEDVKDKPKPKGLSHEQRSKRRGHGQGNRKPLLERPGGNR
jgi:hypothetical protein